MKSFKLCHGCSFFNGPCGGPGCANSKQAKREAKMEAVIIKSQEEVLKQGSQGKMFQYGDY